VLGTVSLDTRDPTRQTVRLALVARGTLFRCCNLGALFIVCGIPLVAQYAGPSILSRGEAPAAVSGPQISFRPYAEISGTYSTGLSDAIPNAQGQLANAGSAGIAFAWGLNGSHASRNTKIGLDYQGSYLSYQQRGFNSLNQTLLLGMTHQFTRHVGMTFSENAGLFSRDFGLIALPQTVPFDPSTTYVPRTDYFDNRTYYVGSTGSLTYQRSARLSFQAAGTFAHTGRRSMALVGNYIWTARGDMQYRVSRRSTVGVLYDFMHYRFPSVQGGTDAQGASGTYSFAISRRLEVSVYGGFLRLETKFIQAVPVAPVIEDLLGITAISQIYYSAGAHPNFSGRIARTYRTGVLYFNGGHSITPGNGIFLTSYATTVAGGYSYTGLRRWSFSTQFAYIDSQARGNIAGTYRGFSGSMNMSRRIAGALHFVSTYSVRQYESSDITHYNRLIQDARVGLGFSPGDAPLRLW
jgi:hypothetical protein